MSSLAKPPVFAGAYLLLMLPTYALPYMGSNSGAAAMTWHLAREAAGLTPLPFFPFWAHLLCLLGLCALTYIRGKEAAKPWLVVFPCLALAFDLLPLMSWIPLVPTVMHLLAIILGVVERQAAPAPAMASRV